MGTKAERTREHLVETALRLFREQGYQRTTMRLIATEAGVSQGNAYYHFSGKDALVQELYVRLQREHRAQAEPRLTPGGRLTENLRAVLHAGIDVMTPYHSFGATMLHAALGTSTAVSPFSAASAPARDAAVGLLADAVASSKGARTHPSRLPELLWLAYLGVTLFWVTDASPGQRRTRQLIDGAAPILARLVTLSRLPLGRGLAADVTALIDHLAAPDVIAADATANHTQPAPREKPILGSHGTAPHTSATQTRSEL